MTDASFDYTTRILWPAETEFMVPSGAAFDPSTLGLDWWLDPSDLSTLFQVSDGTGAVSADADPVGYVVNKGSGNITMIQATSGSRPLYKTSGGLHWLFGDGTDDYLVGDTSGGAGIISQFLTASTFDMMFACRRTEAYDGSVFYQSPGFISDGPTSGYWAVLCNNGPGFHHYNWSGGAQYASVTGAPIAQDADLVIRAWHDSGDIKIAVNDGTPVTTASGNCDQITGAINLFRDNGSSLIQGRIYGIVARKTLFDATEQANLWTYLGAKAGISL